MEQIELLWQYQLADMEADTMESEIRRAPTRITLKKNRDFLVEQQNAIKRIETEVGEMVDRVDVIKMAITRQEEQLKALQKRVAEHPPETLEQTRELQQDAQKLLSAISDYEHEMKHIQKDAADRDRQQGDIRAKYGKVKGEYDKQKVAYEAEYKQQAKTLEEKRAAAEEKAKAVDPKLLERYRAIKLHVTPPMARLNGDQCGGCNMSQPSVVLRNIKSGQKIIECETCGRMLVQ